MKANDQQRERSIPNSEDPPQLCDAIRRSLRAEESSLQKTQWDALLRCIATDSSGTDQHPHEVPLDCYK